MYQGSHCAVKGAGTVARPVDAKSPPVQANTLASASGSSSLHPAESFAQLLLERPSASLGDLLKLFDLLRHEPAPVAGRAEVGGFSFGSGAWVHGNLVGLRTNTYTFPLSTSVFTRHVARHLPQHTFSSLVVLDNVCTLAHRDSHNEPSSKNAVFGLSDFTGGEVWVERAGGSIPYSADGKTLLGDALSTRPGPAVFAARAELHATLPWSGRRVVLVAYTTSHLQKLSSEVKRFAAKLGLKHFAPQVPSVTHPFAVEVFSGTAVLSRALFASGFATLAVDHQPRSALMPTVRLDLSVEAQQSLLLDRLKASLPAALHIAPPCGTASRKHLLAQACL